MSNNGVENIQNRILKLIFGEHEIFFMFTIWILVIDFKL
jgi:hypothetical protein